MYQSITLMLHSVLMKYLRTILLSFLGLSILPVYVIASENAASIKPFVKIPKGYWSLQLENDFLARSGDRQYTHGVEVSFVDDTEPPAWMHALARYLPLFEVGSENWVSYSIGQAIFTPDDITQSGLLVSDRPYAGWLYSSHAYLSQQQVSTDVYHLNVLEATVGIVGPASGAEFTQKFIHSFLPAPDPQGWDKQLNNELGLNLNYVHRWRLYGYTSNDHEYEFSPHLVMSLGNIYTYAGAGVMFRWGSGLRNDIGPPNIRPGFSGSSYFSAKSRRNWYVFAGYESRLMFRNIFLDGNNWSDSHRVSKEFVVGDLQLGFAFHVNNIRIAFSEILRGREFTTQTHLTAYGAVNLTFYYQ